MSDDLRHRYAEALIARIKQSVLVDDQFSPGMVGQPFAATEFDLADAVLAVRDSEVETLRAALAEIRAVLNAHRIKVIDFGSREPSYVDGAVPADRIREVLARYDGTADTPEPSIPAHPKETP